MCKCSLVGCDLQCFTIRARTLLTAFALRLWAGSRGTDNSFDQQRQTTCAYLWMESIPVGTKRLRYNISSHSFCRIFAADVMRCLHRWESRRRAFTRAAPSAWTGCWRPSGRWCPLHAADTRWHPSHRTPCSTHTRHCRSLPNSEADIRWLHSHKIDTAAEGKTLRCIDHFVLTLALIVIFCLVLFGCTSWN
jgi:hypothetical protein